MKRISLNGLKNVLSPKEMKNLMGGSDLYCTCDDGTAAWHCINHAPGSDCGVKEYCYPGGGSCS